MRGTTLYFQDGRSDKVYVIRISPAEGGRFYVHAFYGRRGSVLRGVTKTNASVPLEEAERIYTAILNEKLAEGYKPGPDGTPVQAPPPAQAAGTQRIRPMLLNPITEEEAERLIEDDDWLIEPKFDGERVLLFKTDGVVAGYSRTDKPVSLPQTVVDAFLLAARQHPHLADDVILDGELIGDLYVAFDILRAGPVELLRAGALDRVESVQNFFRTEARYGIAACPHAEDTESKRGFFETLHTNGAEGAVFKLKSASYTPGRPNSGGPALKFKFWHTASVIVSGPNGTKRSVGIKLCDGTELGHVTIPPNKQVPETGAIIEIRYLDRHSDEGNLKQCTFLRLRQDVALEDCNAEQLHIRGEERNA